MNELTDDELLSFLENAEDGPGLNAWEKSFCWSIGNQLRKGWTLSEKQLDVFERGLLKKLWNADPELWRDSYRPQFPERKERKNGKA